MCSAMSGKKRTLQGEAAEAAQRRHEGGGAAQRPFEEDQVREPCKGRSWLYDHFHHRAGDQSLYYCNKCCSGLAGTVDNKTGVLKLTSPALNPLTRHLSKHHGISKDDPGEKVRPSGQSSLQRFASYPKAKNEELLNLFAKEFLIHDLGELTLVERPGVQAFLERLDPRLKLCSRRKMTEKVLTRCLDESEHYLLSLLGEALEDKSCVLHYCGDLWTAAWTGQQHLCHCLQFVTSSFELQTVCVSHQPFEQNKTAVNQKAAINAIFEDFEVPIQQQGCLTTDSEAALQKARG